MWLFIVAGVVLIISYIVIATSIARLSFEVWKEGDNSTLAFLLFPVSALNETVGCNPLTFINGLDNESYYIATFLTWPLRAIWNILALVVVIYILMFRLVAGQVTGRKLRVEAPPESDWERHDRLLQERERLDRELEEIKQKIEGNGGAQVYRLRAKVRDEGKKGGRL